MGNALSSVAVCSQNVSVLIALGLTTGVLLLWPSTKQQLISSSTASSLVNISHLGSFSFWFGVQFWATFVAGLTMFYALPRQWFGKVLHALFQKYFTGGIVLNGVMLSTFLLHHPVNTWNKETLYMGSLLIISNVVTCINGIYIEPATYNISREMYDYEQKYGLDNVIGPMEDKELLVNPTYCMIRKNFFNMHGVANVLHVFTLGVSTYHLWYLSQRLSC